MLPTKDCAKSILRVDKATFGNALFQPKGIVLVPELGASEHLVHVGNQFHFFLCIWVVLVLVVDHKVPYGMAICNPPVQLVG